MFFRKSVDFLFSVHINFKSRKAGGKQEGLKCSVPKMSQSIVSRDGFAP